jgi:hypothetical protein
MGGRVLKLSCCNFLSSEEMLSFVLFGEIMLRGSKSEQLLNVLMTNNKNMYLAIFDMEFNLRLLF